MSIKKKQHNRKNSSYKKSPPKQAKRTHAFLLYLAVALIFVLLVLVFFFISQKNLASIYIYPEKLKQGDTVFIKVKSEAENITGSLGDQKLIFYKKENSSEWISFLGIDADQKPGDYTVHVDTSNDEHLTKLVKVALASFSSAPASSAPSYKKTGITEEKAVSNMANNDDPALRRVLGKFTSMPYFSTPFSFPLSVMKKGGFSFGKFITFVQYKLQHFGVDLQAPERTNIYAVNNGKVVATLNLLNYGKTIIVDHGLDIFSLYLHLDEFKVATGDMIKKGQLIGLSGETGYVTAPHLHFSIRVGGARVDPITFIQTTKKLDENEFAAAINEAFANIVNLFK